VKDKIMKAFDDSLDVKRRFAEQHIELIEETSRLIADRLSSGKKLLLFGNGGSSTDASHIAAEFINRFKMERPALPALALNTDMAVITSISNDYDFSEIFTRQLKALAQEGDVVMAISTSGNSPNVINAIETAKKKNLVVIGLTGHDGGQMASLADFIFKVPSADTPRIQETHITLGHIICQMVEEILFKFPL
jgi:D-sedoheptulose 7-phosphate isomerase